jgi:hypothetical protein
LNRETAQQTPNNTKQHPAALAIYLYIALASYCRVRLAKTTTPILVVTGQRYRVYPAPIYQKRII